MPPDLEVGGQATAAKKTQKIGRDAGDGRFIPFKDAERRPKTTVVETVPVRKGQKKSIPQDVGGRGIMYMREESQNKRK